MDDMCVEMYALFGVAKERAKLAHHGVHPFIAPGEYTIFEVNFLQLATIESVSEAVDPTLVDVVLFIVDTCSKVT